MADQTAESTAGAAPEAPAIYKGTVEKPPAAASTRAASPEASGLMEAFNPGALPYAIGLLLAAVLLVRLMNRLLLGLSERMVSRRLVIKQIGTLIAFGAYAAAALLALNSLFTLSSQALFALSGTIALMLGFALKDVASSFLAGISILVNKPFQVGDRITFGGYYGEVKEIGLRTVRLVTLDDNLVTIPSNKFLTDPVASANAGALDCMVVMKFFISPRADHLRAREIVQEAVLASKYLYLGKPLAVLVAPLATDDGSVLVELTAKAYVYDARCEKLFASDVSSRVLEAFREYGVEMPCGASAEAATSKEAL